MTISKSGRWHDSGLLDVAVYTKPSNRKVPLHSSSANHPSVYLSWPLARMLHSENIVSSYFNNTIAKVRFVSELVQKQQAIRFCRLYLHISQAAPSYAEPNISDVRGLYFLFTFVLSVQASRTFWNRSSSIGRINFHIVSSHCLEHGWSKYPGTNAEPPEIHPRLMRTATAWEDQGGSVVFVHNCFRSELLLCATFGGWS